jgi:Rod binding domain-containing protein
MLDTISPNALKALLETESLDRADGRLREHSATSLTDLRNLEENAEGLREASQEFEAIFLNMLLQQFRESSSSDDGLFPKSSAMETLEGMLDQQMSVDMSGSFGISEVLFQQLGRGLEEYSEPKNDTKTGKALERVG